MSAHSLLALAALAAALPPAARVVVPPPPTAAFPALAAPALTAGAARTKSCAEGLRKLPPSADRNDRGHRDHYASCMGLAPSSAPDVPPPTYKNPRPAAATSKVQAPG